MDFLKKIQKNSLIFPVQNTNCANILLINGSIKEAKEVAASVNSNTFPIIYSSFAKKAELLAYLKTNFQKIDRIGIFFALNTDGTALFLDHSPFFSKDETTRSPHSENTEFLLTLIRDFSIKTVDYLACNTLNLPDWKNYFSFLSNSTEIVIGASNDKTGNLKYGGDWMMENTKQDIEFVYFTKEIEYYMYLLDNLTWSTGIYGPNWLAISGDFIYCSNFTNGNYLYAGDSISKINLADGTLVNLDWATGIPFPSSILINGDFMYVSSFILGEGGPQGSTISKINMSDGSISNLNWATGLNSPVGMAINGDYLYVGNFMDGTISKLNLSNGLVSDGAWATGLSNPFGITIHDSFMYVANIGADSISKINLSDGSIVNAAWATGLNSPYCLVIDGAYMYVSNYISSDTYYSSITKINLSNGTIADAAWVTDVNFIIGLAINGSYLYATNLFEGGISQFDLNRVIPESNICFPANTPILTDQGNVQISKIVPNVHTINEKRIVDITKTILNDKCVVFFEKNSLGLNYPSERTIMSRNHRILFRRKMIEAYKFVGKFPHIHNIEYNGEVLYNVLMENFSVMKVNGFICETLDPENMIAKFYTCKCRLSDEDRDNVVLSLKKKIEKKDFDGFRKKLAKY